MQKRKDLLKSKINRNPKAKILQKSDESVVMTSSATTERNEPNRPDLRRQAKLERQRPKPKRGAKIIKPTQKIAITMTTKDKDPRLADHLYGVFLIFIVSNPILVYYTVYTMSLPLPCWSTHLILLSGPTVAWGYGLCVWIMYSMAHECSWSSKLPSMFGRTSFLVASAACSVGLCQANQSTVAAALPLGTVFAFCSVVLCRWTRVNDVVGVSEAPFFGSRHMQHKNILITGANSGIGKETAIQLASMGATVYLLCRSNTRAQEAVDDILENHSQTIQPEQLKVVAMDLGDLESIRAAVQGPLLKNVEVHVLVNNAGLMMGTKTMSKDGMELMMQANHLGHFLLTRLLLQNQNQMAKDARILNLTSSTYQLVETGFDFDDIMCDKQRKYTLFGQYAQSKLANILFTKELARRYPKHPVFAVHPGLVRTNVTSNMPWILQTLNHMFAWFVASMQKLPAQGAYSNVLCAAGPVDQLPPSGSYIVNCQAHATTKAADSPQDAKRLWTVSEKLVGLRY